MKHSFLFLALLGLVNLAVFAQEAVELRKKHMNLSDGIAIKGYDPVAYFTQNKAVKGNKEYSVYHQGATYYFSSVENKEIFKANPFKYEPEYGGWCAYAMGNSGEKVSIDPATFKIMNGKLYLFYNKYFTNTLNYWNKDEANLKKKADANWPRLFR
ncbi:MAG TPA: YHS domain-containing (seleno)protein [Ferruginibacter sp.]|jgi:YHS domain-containing protein|nr:YHS domain-containing (seleno)protein [Ferruginibacter sp.]